MMSQKKSETAKATKENVEKLGTAIPVRLFDKDKAKLKRYEGLGISSAELIRRCVDRGLEDVIREIREALGRPLE